MLLPQIVEVRISAQRGRFITESPPDKVTHHAHHLLPAFRTSCRIQSMYNPQWPVLLTQFTLCLLSAVQSPSQAMPHTALNTDPRLDEEYTRKLLPSHDVWLRPAPPRSIFYPVGPVSRLQFVAGQTLLLGRLKSGVYHGPPSSTIDGKLIPNGSYTSWHHASRTFVPNARYDSQ